MKHIFIVLLLLASFSIYAQDESAISFDQAYKRVYNINKITGERPVIDGKLDEPVWTEQGEWTKNFVQVTPNERIPSNSPTKAKLFYDEKYIYVGIVAKDAFPEQLNCFIGNRDDNSIGDLVSIAFDTYHNFWAAPEFNINAGGNKTDLVVTDKLSVNRNWNAVWEGRTHVDLKDSCWTIEMRIPFSQLRYNQETADGVWGLHIRRVIRRNNEVQNWSMIPLKNNGHVFSFGEMHGMTDLPRPRNIEFLPYAMGKLQRQPAQEGPYGARTRWNGNAGLDVKTGLSDFTIDITINPDYGQVEQDPSVMNLTAYETFYDEKRPFFLEGKHILDFSYGSDLMFYTRRIGAAPSYQPANINYLASFAEQRDVVPIIGALKITGSNNRGLTLGILQSVTAKTSVRVTRDGKENRETVEPLTNFTVARIQKNWKGNTYLGGMFSSTNRITDEPTLKDYLAENAITAAIDFSQFFSNRLYYIEFKGMFTTVDGSESAIYRRQCDAVHYFQRESAQNYLKADPTRQSLSGTGGYFKIGRKGNAKWTFAETLGWMTPGFDLNDIGYLREADVLNNDSEISFRQTDTWKFFRSNTLTLNQVNKWNFGGQNYESNLAFTARTMFVNLYQVQLTEKFVWNRLDTRVLRGGPDLRIDPYFSTNIRVNTNTAKRMSGSLQYIGEHNVNGYSLFNSLSPGITLRVGNHIHLSGNFNYQWNTNDMQYVGQAVGQISGKTYYVTGAMDQQTYGVTLRIQANISPDISIQFYGSPFTSIASYSNFKRNDQTTSQKYGERYHQFVSSEISQTDNDRFTVLENGDHYSFSLPDFSFNEFRSNLVFRWEYLPGSTLYFAWIHSLSNRKNQYVSGWRDNLDTIFDLPSTNTFMVKMNFWFGM